MEIYHFHPVRTLISIYGVRALGCRFCHPCGFVITSYSIHYTKLYDIYPAVDPLDSTSRQLDPLVVGKEHYDVARGVQTVLQRYKELKDIIAILGMDELSEVV